jgi:hypothetical protein
MTKVELEKLAGPLESKQPGTYSTNRVPNGHSRFESYSLIAPPTHGLCKIVAIGVTIEMNDFGTQLQAEFAEIEEALSEKYGRGKRFDYLLSGSIWKDPEDWAMGLFKEERVLSSYWIGSLGSARARTDQTQSVSLTARAFSSSSGYLSLVYEFDNAVECLDEVKKLKNSVL